MGMSSLLFAYVGPDTLLPLTSGLAGALGVFLMFGRQVRRLAVRSWRFIVRK
jgi:hypothetical protein